MPEGQVTRLVACDAQLSDLYNPTGTPTEELIAFMTKVSSVGIATSLPAIFFLEREECYTQCNAAYWRYTRLCMCKHVTCLEPDGMISQQGSIC